ncbi:hypothetical protein OHT61_12000 [Streptomyces sp. NBC_00178]|nr:hypothetical protein [Streptomyces sp. NBC_00178]
MRGAAADDEVGDSGVLFVAVSDASLAGEGVTELRDGDVIVERRR